MPAHRPHPHSRPPPSVAADRARARDRRRVVRSGTRRSTRPCGVPGGGLRHMGAGVRLRMARVDADRRRPHLLHPARCARSDRREHGSRTQHHGGRPGSRPAHRDQLPRDDLRPDGRSGSGGGGRVVGQGDRRLARDAASLRLSRRLARRRDPLDVLRARARAQRGGPATRGRVLRRSHGHRGGCGPGLRHGRLHDGCRRPPLRHRARRRVDERRDRDPHPRGCDVHRHGRRDHATDAVPGVEYPDHDLAPLTGPPVRRQRHGDLHASPLRGRRPPLHDDGRAGHGRTRRTR